MAAAERLDLLRRLPSVGELECEAERLVGLGVLADDKDERRNELLQLRDGEQRLLDVRGVTFAP